MAERIGFTSLPTLILTEWLPALSKGETLFVLYLARQGCWSGERWCSANGVNEIAQELKMTDVTVRRILRDLIEAGALHLRRADGFREVSLNLSWSP